MIYISTLSLSILLIRRLIRRRFILRRASDRDLRLRSVVFVSRIFGRKSSFGVGSIFRRFGRCHRDYAEKSRLYRLVILTLRQTLFVAIRVERTASLNRNLPQRLFQESTNFSTDIIDYYGLHLGQGG